MDRTGISCCMQHAFENGPSSTRTTHRATSTSQGDAAKLVLPWLPHGARAQGPEALATLFAANEGGLIGLQSANVSGQLLLARHQLCESTFSVSDAHATSSQDVQVACESNYGVQSRATAAISALLHPLHPSEQPRVALAL